MFYAWKPPSCGSCSTFPSLCHCLFCLGFFPQRPQHKLHVGGDPGLPAVNCTSLPSLDLYLHVLLTLAVLPPIAHLSTDTLCSPCLLLGIIPPFPILSPLRRETPQEPDSCFLFEAAPAVPRTMSSVADIQYLLKGSRRNYKQQRELGYEKCLRTFQPTNLVQQKWNTATMGHPAR